MRLTFVTLVVIALALSGYTFADDIGVNFSSPGPQSSPSVWNFGYQFRANSNSTVTALGVFDYNQDGFSQPQQVGLWTISGTLLASVYVDNSDLPVDNFWRFASISGVTLTAGQNYVVGSQGGEGYTYGTHGFVVAPEITFVQDAWVYIAFSNNPLVFPTSTSGLGQGVGGGYFGGNIEFGTATATPEPGTLLLVGSGLLGIGRMYAKQKPKKTSC